MEANKARYEVLDGLRGVAALAILWRHICFVTNSYQPPPNSHLAVDFFFCLSGFVIAHAYEQRLRSSMSAGQFILERLVRLLPLAAFGAVVGGVVLGVRAQVVHDLPALNIVAATLLNAVLLPSFSLIPIHPEAFGANTPLWSLFWEMAVNIAFALAVPWLTTRRLIFILIFAAGLLVAMAVRFHGVDGGPNSATFVWGACRVLFPFACGVLLHRLPIFTNRFAAPLAAVLAGLLLAPAIGMVGELISVLLVFPAVVMSGAGAKVGPRLGGVALWLGRLSYPLYVLHHPIIRLTYNALQRFHIASPQLVAAACVLISIAVAWAAMELYDEPVRRWLRAKLLPNRSAKVALVEAA